MYAVPVTSCGVHGLSTAILDYQKAWVNSEDTRDLIFFVGFVCPTKMEREKGVAGGSFVLVAPSFFKVTITENNIALCPLFTLSQNSKSDGRIGQIRSQFWWLVGPHKAAAEVSKIGHPCER